MSKELVKKTSDTFAKIEERILGLQETGVQFPQNYSPINAAQSARMILQETKDKSGKSALEVCTPPSIANAILKMVTLGLNPIKKQCYFLVYGNKLECQTSYQGNIAIAKRFGLKDVKAVLLHEGDDFQYSIEQDGRIKVVKHTQSFGSLNKKIIGAYAVTTMEDGTIDTTIMTMEDIQNAWRQGATNGNSPAHKNFSGEMAKKSVINRACKGIINSSDDAALLEDEPTETPTEAHVKHQIKENANREEIGFDEYEEAEEEQLQEVNSSEDEEENQRAFEEAMAEENGQSAMKGPGF